MIRGTANKIRYLSILTILASAIMITPATAAGGALKVDITRYEPYPAEIGKYVDIWVNVKNMGGGTAEDVTIELMPKYPFTLDSSSNARQNKGSIGTESSAMYEYRLFVADDAKPGTHEITIRYQDDEGTTWSERDFEIKVGTDTLDSRGTLKLEAIKTDPEVFIPGDEGTVTITLTNTASQYSVTINGKDYDTNAQLNEVELIGSNGIVVTTDSYHDMGVLGPDDSIEISYNVHVSDDAADGTEHLNLALTGSSHTYNAKWNIPVRVESAGIKIIPSKPLKLACDGGKIEFDVANTHSSMFTSVSIEPQVEGITFTPTEYFIGTMDPDELFTIDFDCEVTGNPSDAADLHLYAEYRNGNNQHERAINNRVIEIEPLVPAGNYSTVMIGAALLLVVVVGAGVYHRKRRKN
ncbi:MAG: hypothetical protein C4B59_06655 [Candidatus Methanogaster sp.]|uniref:Uncharacterized protein n=1 Tax=Candidatus Methanogaster sp. TaxID=3386292 RepID=A0AC61L3Z1_9EURY|nr:MAG: hypothetical protein C4B59_06655 [ANME-2 cluster archaeon]